MGNMCSSQRVENSKSTVKRRVKLKNTVIQIVNGSIISESTTAIVNPTNKLLSLGTSETSLKILRLGGVSIQRECFKHTSESLGAGSIILTEAGRLNCSKIMHIVSPVYIDGNAGEADYLRLSVNKILEKADERGIRSLSLPSICTGPYNYPKDESAKLMFRVLLDYITAHNTQIELIKLVESDHINIFYLCSEFDKYFQDKELVSCEELQDILDLLPRDSSYSLQSP